LLIVASADVFKSPLDRIAAILAAVLGITGALLPEQRADRNTRRGV
jgi:hypothetical protein